MLVTAAHARKTTVAVHVSTVAGARTAVAAGADLLAHVPGGEAVEPAFAAQVAARTRGVIATLSVLGAYGCANDPAALRTDQRISRYLEPALRDRVGNPWPNCHAGTLDSGLANVSALHRAGVPILAGTDAGNTGVVSGASLLGELTLLVRAGLTPVEALRAGTSVPARAFALTDRGRVAAGQRADLVLVHGDPTIAIDDVRDIVAVWKRLPGHQNRILLGRGFGLALLMTVRVSARIACLAIVAAEATAVVRRAEERPTLVFWIVFVALQIVAVVWATDRRSSAVLRMVAPALLAAVTVAAGWTALALAIPVIATDDTAALVAILAIGPAMATSSRRSAGQRLLPLVLIASAGSALLIFLVISCVLPAVHGFVSNSHPPVYTKVSRVVDPVRELGICVLLAVALGVDLLRARIRTRRAAARQQRLGDVAGPNEMVVERPV